MTTEELLGQERRQAGESLAREVKMPEFSSAADFDARITKMLADDERREREKQEKKIQRQQIAQGLVDTWGIFGDVVKASEGALVTPRDIQKKYNDMDEKSQKIYDNYRARLDVLRQQIAARAKGDRDMALQARMKANDQAAADARAKQQHEWDMEMARLNARNRGGGGGGRGGRGGNGGRGGGGGSTPAMNDIEFGDKIYSIPKGSDAINRLYHFLATYTGPVTELVNRYTLERIGENADGGTRAITTEQKLDIVRDVLYSLDDIYFTNSKGERKSYYDRIGGTVADLLERGRGTVVTSRYKAGSGGEGSNDGWY